MRHGNAVAGGDRVTVEASRQILEQGGNAFDAAVAGVFASMAAEPCLTSPAGGGVLLARPAGGHPIAFDFFVDMPRGESSDPDFFDVEVDFGAARQTFHVGRAAAAVPGNVAGLLHVHAKLGTLPLGEILDPAIRAAREGVTLSAMQGYLIRILAPILRHDELSRRLFAPHGELLAEGALFRNAELADFLESLAGEGADLFYRGEIARRIASWAARGGLIIREDLEAYRVEERTPLAVDFAGHQVLLNPPPAQSGVLIARTLSLLEGGRGGGPVQLEELVEAFDQTNRSRAGVVPGSTTHLSVLDNRGNAATVTTTNGEGCGYLLPGAGFMINNMLGEEDLNPGGFFRYAGGERLATMLAPSMVLAQDRTVLLTGTAGSNRIRSVVVQVIVNVLCNGMDLKAATEAPRLHLEEGILHFEPGTPVERLQPLASRYTLHPWPETNLFFGGANSVAPDAAAGDPRRGGQGIVFR